MVYRVLSNGEYRDFDDIESARAYAIKQMDKGHHSTISVGDNGRPFGTISKTQDGEYRWKGLSGIRYRLDRRGRLISKISDRYGRSGGR